jgi:hypothetical protein
MKKPVKRKVKGYDQGGTVDKMAQIKAQQDALRDRFDRSDKTPGNVTAYRMATQALTGQDYNEMSDTDRAYIDKVMGPNLDNAIPRGEARARYPGFAKGGKVRKVAKAATKRKR